MTEASDAAGLVISPPPASGAWRPGDPVGRRQFFALRRRPALRRSRAAARSTTVDVAYETWGELDADGEQRHARLPRLTGDSHAAGPVGRGHRRPAGGRASIGPGLADRHRPLLRRVRQRARRLPGLDRPGVDRAVDRPAATARASRWSRSATWCAPRPRLADHLGDRALARVVGGSMGGMQVLEWGVMYPGPGAVARRRSPRARQATAQQIALGSDRAPGDRARPEVARRRLLRRRARRRPARGPGHRPHDRPDHVPQRRRVHRPVRPRARSSRSPDGFELWQRFEVERYLDYHGDKLVRRFDANSLPADQQGDGPARHRPRPGRARGGAGAHRASRCCTIGISSDMLYPTYQQQQIRDVLARPRAATPSTSRSTARTATTPS